MKYYEKEYEDIFNTKLIKNKMKLDLVSTYNEIPDSIDKYIRLYKKTYSNFQKETFDSLVKMVWLTRRFCYNDVRKINNNFQSFYGNRAFCLFLRNIIGFENRLLSNANSFFNRLTSYFPDFFPNFDEGNPFEDKYEYPYKYLNFECLLFVYLMPERMDLLEYGENHKMTYINFMDYVVNYVGCYNEEHGRVYKLSLERHIVPHIRKYKKE